LTPPPEPVKNGVFGCANFCSRSFLKGNKRGAAGIKIKNYLEMMSIENNVV
jgi:hypothetical protein